MTLKQEENDCSLREKKVIFIFGVSLDSSSFKIFLRPCLRQKALQLPLFSSLYFSLQQIWTD